ncbi:hypothetical protein DFH11DRAFT_1595602 [Phellopilus nigrolimitatus]|nr:hypothetical protein DFH11DRAFT_1595602 [Phellopilus nigrolimitatus]
MDTPSSQNNAQEMADRERENARGYSLDDEELSSIGAEARAAYLLEFNESSQAHPELLQVESRSISSPAHAHTGLSGHMIIKQYTFIKENDMKLSCLDVLENKTVLEYTPGAGAFAHKIINFGIDKVEGTEENSSEVILVVHLADVYGAVHIEVLRICTMDWSATTLIKKELPIGKDYAETHQSDRVRVFANAQSALLLVREYVILVDWLVGRLARLLIPTSASIESMEITDIRNLHFVTFDDEGDFVDPSPSLSQVFISIDALWTEAERMTASEGHADLARQTSSS